jgi:hypothetical protein
VWLGDFNYRLEGMLNQHQVVQAVEAGQYDRLLEQDQLNLQRKEGSTFRGMKEGKVDFPPTYKFDKGKQSQSIMTDIHCLVFSCQPYFVLLFVFCPCRLSTSPS